MSFRLSEARVTESLGYLNHYLVELVEGGGPQLALDVSGSSSRSGVRGGKIWGPGAQVLTAVGDTVQQIRNYSYPLIYILGSSIRFPQTRSTDFVPVFLAEDSPVGFSNPYLSTIFSQSQVPLFFQDRSYGRPLDVVAGDYLLQNMLNGVFLMSDWMSRHGASPQAYQEFLAETALYRHICQSKILETDSTSDSLTHRGDLAIGIQEFAATIQESLGGLRTAPYVFPGDPDEPSRLQVLHDDQAGFFRYRNLYGGFAEGTWRHILFPRDSRESYRFSDAADPALLSEQFRDDGVYRLQAAREIRFEKTATITVPKRRNEPNVPDRAVTDPGVPEDDVAAKIDALGLQGLDEYYALQPLLSSLYSGIDDTQVFYGKMRMDSGLWIFPTRDEISAAVFGEAEDPVLPVLPEQSREYTLEDLVSVITEIYPGRNVRLFKNKSVFLMADDGGFSISDGFGGEIRMNRGSVTITSSGDTTIAAGRDVIELTGGNRIMKARKRIEVVSTEGSMIMKAEGAMNLVSGGENGGALVLENRSPNSSLNDVDPRSIQEGNPGGSGIQLLGREGPVNITGQSLYVGPSIPGENPGATKAGLPNSSMEILLNAGSGPMMATGGSLSLQGLNTAYLGIAGQSTSLALSGSILAVIADSVVNTCSSYQFAKGSGSIKKPYINESGVQERSVRLPGGEPYVVVEGSVVAAGVIASKEQIQCEGAVVANSGCNPTALTGFQRIQVSIPKTANVGSFVEATLAYLIQGMESAISNGSATEYGQKICGAAFPSSNSAIYRAQDFSFTGYLWQGMLQGAAKWVENPVLHDIVGKTMPFPGKEVYDADKNVLLYPKDGALIRVPFKDYPVNDNQ